MSEYVTEAITEKVKGSKMAKHIVMKSILRENMVEDTTEVVLNDIIMKIYNLFYDSNMVKSLYSDIRERERKKQELQETDLRSLAESSLDTMVETDATSTDSVSMLEIDDGMIENLTELGEKILYEDVYRVLNLAQINVIIDFFSVFQGSTSSLMETTSQFTSVDMKEILETFSLFVEKQIEDPKSDRMNQDQMNLNSSVLNVNIGDTLYSIFLYTPHKWLDPSQTQRLSIGLMIQDDWAKYISIMPRFIAKKLNIIADTVLDTAKNNLANISFQLVDLTFTKKLKIQTREIAEYISRLSLSWDQIQSSQSVIETKNGNQN